MTSHSMFRSSHTLTSFSDSSPVCASPAWAAYLAYHLSCPPSPTSPPGLDNPQAQGAAAERTLGGFLPPASSVGESRFCCGFCISDITKIHMSQNKFRLKSLYKSGLSQVSLRQHKSSVTQKSSV